MVSLDARAPGKPDVGGPCNGCGVCCAVETCPLGLLLFRRRKGPCPGLGWQSEYSRYVCGVLADPKRFLGWLPASLGRALVFRWIAAGKGCDSTAILMDVEPSSTSTRAHGSGMTFPGGESDGGAR
ncbi:hypothetical protein [Paramagnetospirillum kuznetsovii]|uniref:hypothetical protein n=1 Tax=Paramagnetospirillum kuznetsovii TaxID=2053833 RepID=UPI00195F8DFB|nr:hypothetical protein [Paramagnetospirillum kuznetsovii]